MLLNGTNIESQDSEESQACLTIAQLILSNMKKTAKSSGIGMRHCQEREPPLSLYLGMNIHTQSRSKKTVNQLHRLGLSVSYNMRVDEVVISGRRCVTILRLSASFALPMFSEISSLLQQITTSTIIRRQQQRKAHFMVLGLVEVVGQEAANSANQYSTPRDITLPNSYSVVPPVSVKTSDVDVPAALQATEDNSYSNQLSTAMAKQDLWLEHCGRHLDDDLTKGTYLSWAAYHASIAHASNLLPTLGGLLPLFDEKAATPAMVKHAMDVQRKATAPTEPYTR